MREQIYQWINILALLYFVLYKRKNREYASFGIFLFFVVLCESVIPHFLSHNSPERVMFISIYATLCVFYYQYFFLGLLKYRPNYNLHKWLFISYFIFRLIDFAVIKTQGYRSIQYMIGMLFVFYLYFTYAYYVLMKDQFRPLREYPGLWLGLGLALFFVAGFPLIIFLDFWVINGTYSRPYQILIYLGNILLSLGYLLMVWFIPAEKKAGLPVTVTSLKEL